jgi:hypothetical protein
MLLPSLLELAGTIISFSEENYKENIGKESIVVYTG